MSRAPHPARGKVAPAAPIAGDPAATIPAVPATEPLPSDETASLVEVVAPAPLVEPLAGIETAPLPRPERAPGENAATATAHPPLEHVDGTVPLPSDQLTPLVSPIGETDVSASTASAIASAADEAAMLGRAPLASRGPGERSDAGPLFGDDFLDRDRLEQLAPDILAQTRASIEKIVAGGRMMLDALASIERFGTGEFAGHDRASAEASPVGDTVAGSDLKRRFRVVSDVHHDGRHVPAGKPVLVDQEGFERLRAGGSLPAAALWADGEDA